MCWGQGEGPGARVPEDDRPTVLCSRGFGPDSTLRLVGRRLAASPGDDAPLPSRFWAAGFSFSRSRLLQEVPHLPRSPKPPV